VSTPPAEHPLIAARPTGTGPAVEAVGVVKRFGDFTAVAGIDFAVAPGETFGFLGPNGAGKSSTMRMVGCVSHPTEGTMRVLGRDPRRDGPEIRGRLGVVPQQDTLDGELTVMDNMYVYGRFFRLPRAEVRARGAELLEFVQLADRATAKVDELSGGMKRRLTIARALINRPELVLLDEPTTGLDPQARHLLWERLYRLRADGVTLVLTTHYMDEAEQLCDRLVIMDRGRIVAEGGPAELIRRHAARDVVELRLPAGAEPPSGVLEELADHVERLPDRVLLSTDDGDQTLAAVIGRGVAHERAVVRRATLEDVFLRLTGRTLVD
jgi:lipooligosaccharide transport system ATP-binding protein